VASLSTRSIRPPDDITPNPNDPASVPPSTVGPDQFVAPGDPHGVVLADSPAAPPNPPARIMASAWSGWPADWWPPAWHGHLNDLTDTAWTCLDRNSSVVASMQPYLVGAASTLDAGWLENPDPDAYSSWDEFAQRLFWDFQGVGETFVMATARYSSGWPARFHVVPPWAVNVEMVDGLRRYTIGSLDVTADICHLRYLSSVDDAHGHGPLEAGRAKLVAAQVLARYGSGLAASGGVPPSVLEHPEELTAEQATELQAQWVAARQSTLGEPAVLSGGVTWKATSLNPTEMALLDLLQFNESRIAVLLRVPPHLVALPSGGDSMTYANVNAIFDYHWRDGLRPLATRVMNGLSGWLLPRGTRIEVNKDAYIQPGPLERAQAAEIWHRIRDENGQPVLSVEQIQQAERFRDATPIEGALR
jgi:HK97 family phage portal protein